MKMIILITKDNDADEIMQTLLSAEYRITRISSTSGFLRSGLATFLIGIKDERVESALELIRKTLTPLETGEKRATIFIIPIERFEQI